MFKSQFTYLLFLSWIFLLGCNSKEDNEWGYRKLLPKSASDIKEIYWRDGFLPDYEYYLRANISRQEFIKYCDTLCLNLHLDSSKYSDDISNLNTGGAAQNDKLKGWWDTKTNHDSLYVWQKGDEWNIVRYFNGCVYLYAHEH